MFELLEDLLWLQSISLLYFFTAINTPIFLITISYVKIGEVSYLIYFLCKADFYFFFNSHLAWEQAVQFVL